MWLVRAAKLNLGYFEYETAAEQYIDTIPDELKEFQQRTVLSGLNYPFYIVEC
ncbi:hypothetical protein J2T19_002091 [Paenibacillus tundrae]|uniref:Uncharacterized protein n=1 Tax=Paenibacillus tundrae TaxID=528187 RepID=A0ABT9WBL1_9BACL|nr:hypothetical protein [Paenibacillus tundrae]